MLYGNLSVPAEEADDSELIPVAGILPDTTTSIREKMQPRLKQLQGLAVLLSADN